MSIVFFINKSNGFPKSMISFMESYFPNLEKVYYTVDRRKEEELPKLENVHRIFSYKEFINNKKLIEDIRKADKIIVSGVFTLQYILPIYGKNILKKTYWQFWGGDYEVFRSEKETWKLRIRKKIVAKCLKKARGIILLTQSEKSAFEEVFDGVGEKKFFYVVVPAGKEDEEVLFKIRKEKKSKLQKKITIGNSATKSNRHLEIFDKLKHFDLSKIDLVCPLSYGDFQYRDIVVEDGKKKFGENFHPLIKYMDYEEYIRFLNSCDVGIYNNNRQQALGNISLMLNLGKKVYAPNSICKYYRQFGYNIFSIDQINSLNILELFEFSSEESQRNIECYELRRKEVIAEWKKIIEEDGIIDNID